MTFQVVCWVGRLVWLAGWSVGKPLKRQLRGTGAREVVGRVDKGGRAGRGALSACVPASGWEDGWVSGRRLHQLDPRTIPKPARMCKRRRGFNTLI